MNDLEVHVKDSRRKDEGRLCGVLKTRGDRGIDGQTYTISCDGMCGDIVMLQVRHKTGKHSYPACIHMSEVVVNFEGKEVTALYIFL
jgi:hypothetical protein